MLRYYFRGYIWRSREICVCVKTDLLTGPIAQSSTQRELSRLNRCNSIAVSLYDKAQQLAKDTVDMGFVLLKTYNISSSGKLGMS